MAADRNCTISGCGKPLECRGYCHMHYQRWRKFGDPFVTAYVHNAPEAGSPRWTGDGVGYVGAHQRVRKAKGPASLHSCSHCSGPARHWAYDGLDVREKQDTRGRPYSPWPEHYMPLCVPCHKRFDLSRRSEVAA